MDLYALKLKTSSKLLGFSVTSNGDDAKFCNSTTVELNAFSDDVWVATSLKAVTNAMISTDWYNSSFEHPLHNFKPEELEIVHFKS